MKPVTYNVGNCTLRILCVMDICKIYAHQFDQFIRRFWSSKLLNITNWQENRNVISVFPPIIRLHILFVDIVFCVILSHLAFL
jgi:hypothetical protein